MHWISLQAKIWTNFLSTLSLYQINIVFCFKIFKKVISPTFQKKNSTGNPEFDTYEETYGDYQTDSPNYNPNADFELI